MMLGSSLRMSHRFLGVAAVALVLTGWAAEARAEIVVLTSGRTLSVKSHRFDGMSVILTLRTGGEVTCDKSIVEKILPDEVPYPEPVLAGSAATAPAEVGDLLEATPYGEIISAMSEAHGVD